MRAPIAEFLDKYAASDTVRLHMPGHKGTTGVEKYDITEIKGADSLYDAEGIIKESEAVASELFGARTYYSTEGSSLAIKAMLYLALFTKKRSGRPLVLAGRNAHRAFVSAAALLDLDVEWLLCEDSYLSCHVDGESLKARLDELDRKPDAVYLTSPDYLGSLVDVGELADVCHERGILLLIDNAHGAYLRFIEPSLHPIDLGADMCADSAHKTLPVLTGGAYLHLGERLGDITDEAVRSALALFGSTSPSYLILRSLDLANIFLATEMRGKMQIIISKIASFKAELSKIGYEFIGDEPMKISIDASAYGYTGEELAELLRGRAIECEFADRDSLTLMPSVSDIEAVDKLLAALLEIPRGKRSKSTPPKPIGAERITSIREAMMMPSVRTRVEKCVGRVLAAPDAACPPAVPILFPGERISEEHVKLLSYYGKTHLTVVDD
ncbi:MAG: PLP-dependent transferase [Clostridia bacterium]|nr:PLP-dependent transferase [Clostridia bacterium]